MRPDPEPGSAHAPGKRPAPPAIQPHGVLLAIDGDGHIARLAGNTVAMLGLTPAELLGHPLAAAFDQADGPELAWPLDAATACPRHLATWCGRRGPWDLAAHRAGEHTLIECEPAPADAPDTIALLAAVRDACDALDAATGIRARCQACAQAIRGLSGFDRVWVHRIDAEGGLEAMAWSAATLSATEAEAPWLATLEAEALRHAVPDVGYVPAPVLPEQAEGSLDIRHGILRGLAPAWRDHLKRLGVAAVLSFPLVVHGRTWGIVTCYHGAVRFLPGTTRNACELVAQACAWRIGACERDEHQRQAAADREEALLLVQEANHRVQNNLHLVASMLRLQARQADNAQARFELESAAARLSAVGAAHRQLSRPGEAGGVQVDRYLEQLCHDLAASWGDAWTGQLSVDACRATLATDAIATLGLVVTELLTNAVKYAYRGAPGPIGVSASRNGRWLRVSVSDQGQGMRRGAASSGLGTRLIRLFAAQLGGDIETASGGQGTTVTLRVPLPSMAREGEPTMESDTR